jgi:HEAT repeat protein
MRRVVIRLSVVFPIAACLMIQAVAQRAPTLTFSGAPVSRSVAMTAGETVEVSVGLPQPSRLPPNGRIAVEWAGYRKVLHALDPDFYMVYRAPKPGTVVLAIRAVEDEEPIFNLPRWRELGSIQQVERFPKRTPWPAGLSVPLRADVSAVNFGASARGMVIEAEPNDAISSAQPLAIGASGKEETWHITGSADDIEYFDNGKAGSNGIDWFRLEYKGTSETLFTANLTTADPMVVSQVLFYTADGKEYREGANANERVHQQLEGHRTAISRMLKPGGVYFLKVEANAPGYEVELRLRRPAPFTDPRAAVRLAMYDHVAQVDAWLLNRPRGAAVDRRIRDTGSLLGSHCMSCHTQSGVWGPAGPMSNGYRVENVANLRRLMNVMYESLRPTNVLQDAANNTSLAPLDLGDGPAGTRVAGFNVATIEKLIPARQLHAAQQVRTANFVLQSADPSGINAAGPGSNIGQALVYRFATEILRRAWADTRDEKYLRAMEEKAARILSVMPRYSDDLSNRIEFTLKTFPPEYVDARGGSDEALSLRARLSAQAAADERRLRGIQKADGSWGFHPGVTTDNGWTWKNGSEDPKDSDPAPTALALTALAALGYDDRDPAVKRGVDALLRMQDPYGRWNRNALTGFVTTAYAEHALSRLYPAQDAKPSRATFEPKAGESLADTVGRFRAMAQLGFGADESRFLDLVLPGASHRSPQVRYWAQIALGALHNERGLPSQLAGLDDPVKMVREAARWGLRQTLLDDKGWDHVYAALESGGDLVRESIAGALIMRADAVLSRSTAGLTRLAEMIGRMMNDDPHPAVRAWASRAAWNWWIWNPPVRAGLNQAFLRSLEGEEPSILAETAKRYQTEALLIANGQRANGSKEHQYPELTQLVQQMITRAEAGSPLLRQRLLKVAATYYSTAGGDGGPGQMGYVTPKMAELMGKAILPVWKQAEESRNADWVRLSIEASANVTYEPLQKKVLDYSSSGPEHLRTLASTSLSDPRVISLPATQEFLEPLAAQIQRGAQEPERRTELVGPLVKLFSRARWDVPKTEEQQRIFFDILLPQFPPERGKLDENTRELAQMEKEPADWYLARSIGQIIHGNPDLQIPALLRKYPAKFATPMEELLWLPAVRWLMTHETAVPEVRPRAAAPALPARDRAVDQYIRALSDPSADRRIRSAALGLASDRRIHTDARIRPVLAKVRPSVVEEDPAEVQKMDAAWRENYQYFKNWVSPELTRANREDEFSCLGCHGVPGRVPSMELSPADDAGYLGAKATYRNYVALLDRVNEADVENSKFLRKPLNVQSGQEDGHQGGRRYNPGDRGYEIIRRWVLDAAALKAKR